MKMTSKRMVFAAIALAALATWGRAEEAGVVGYASAAFQMWTARPGAMREISIGGVSAIPQIAADGEEVSATSPRGENHVLAADANDATAATWSPAPDRNGEWTLAKNGETAAFFVTGLPETLAVTAGKWGVVVVETGGVRRTTFGPGVTTNLVVAYGSSVTATAVPNVGYAVDGNTDSVSFDSFTNAAEVAFAFQPDPVPELRWKYAKNANGWHCAQLAFPWHTGYEEAIGNLRFLFADRYEGGGRLSAYLVDSATAIDPLGTTETYRDVEYRALPVDLTAFAGLADGARAVYGVSDATMTNGLSSVPRAERKICLRVVNRDLSTVGRVDNKLAILAWNVGGSHRFLPLAETMSSAQPSAAAVNSSFAIRHSSFATQPLSVEEANLSASFALAPAAVARGQVVCQIASLEISADGAVSGTFAIGAESADVAVAESGELSGGVRFTVLGAAGLGGAFAPLDAAECGVELLSRTPPYAFRVERPGAAHFFKILLETEDVFE